MRNLVPRHLSGYFLKYSNNKENLCDFLHLMDEPKIFVAGAHLVVQVLPQYKQLLFFYSFLIFSLILHIK